MRTLGSAVVSSALLLLLGAAGLHPASAVASGMDAPSADPRVSVLITEFYPCAVDGDEYVVLCNCGTEAVNLLDWALSDGEGSVRLPGRELLPRESFVVSERASSYLAAYGALPDLSVEGWSPEASPLASGAFRLSDAGEVIWLAMPDGEPADAVAYGSAKLPFPGWVGSPLPSLRPGEVARRSSPDGAFADTGCVADWTPFREYRYGYTSHSVLRCSLPPGALAAFASPDCSFDIVCESISGASASIRLCTYELSSSAVCGLLADAARRGVIVRVLVDASPVGGMSSLQVDCLSALTAAGVDVRVLGGRAEDGMVRHVGVLHAKYMLVDGSTAVVLSENFVEDGIPSDRLFGNRGWGVRFVSPEAGPFLEAVFDDDSRIERTDVWPWAEDARHRPDARIPEPQASTHPEGMVGPHVCPSWSEVSLYVSPDASPYAPFLSPLLSQASRVVFEQFRADLLWVQRWSDEPVLNPLVEGVAAAMARGGEAKGLLDGAWFNRDGNSEVAAYLSKAAVASGRAPSFGLLADESPVTSLHNKGLVLDDRSLVSSNNWVFPSFSRNRELAVLVEDLGVSSYFSGVFELDWVPDTTPPAAEAGPDISVDSVGELVLDGSASRDDRAVAEYRWDFDGDGVPDAYGPVASYTPPSAGTHSVRLSVVDAWGNIATDQVLIAVGPAPGGHAPAAQAPSVHWLVPAAASIALAAMAAARKLNLPRHRIGRKG